MLSSIRGALGKQLTNSFTINTATEISSSCRPIPDVAGSQVSVQVGQQQACVWVLKATDAADEELRDGSFTGPAATYAWEWTLRHIWLQIFMLSDCRNEQP